MLCFLAIWLFPHQNSSKLAYWTTIAQGFTHNSRVITTFLFKTITSSVGEISTFWWWNQKPTRCHCSHINPWKWSAISKVHPRFGVLSRFSRSKPHLKFKHKAAKKCEEALSSVCCVTFAQLRMNLHIQHLLYQIEPEFQQQKAILLWPQGPSKT